MVYEGDDSGNGKRTSAGWQNNRMTDSYVEEIEAYFDNVERRGKLIIASEPKQNLPQASWEIQPGQAVKFSMQEPVEESNRLIADAYFEGMEWTKGKEASKGDVRLSAKDIWINSLGMEPLRKETENNIKQRHGIIVNNRDELIDHIHSVTGNDSKANLYIGGVRLSNIDKIETDLGASVFTKKEKGQYAFCLSYDDIRHIAKHYANADETADAVERIYSMVSSYDTIAYEIHEKGGNRLVLKKNFADADFLTVDIVANQNRNIDLVTMYITKKNKGSQANPPATQSSSQRGSASNNRITPTGDSVNTSIRKSGENDASTPISQAVSSAKTSIKQIPALFRDKNVSFDKVNIDIGGGKYDLATDYLSSIGTQNRVFDPYNRSAEVNSDTLSFLQQGNRGDTATCANVLNVIAEPEARANVILEAAKSIKPDGKAYFMVYEGDGTGIGKETSSGWQNNRKTAFYVDEIKQYFDVVERKGKLVIASSPISNLPKASWEIQPGKAVRFSMKEPVEECSCYIEKHTTNKPRTDRPTLFRKYACAGNINNFVVLYL